MTLTATRFATAACLLFAPLYGAVITLPAGASGSELGSSDSAPLGADHQRVQQVLDASILTGLNVGDRITGLTFRVDSGAMALPAQTVSSYEIRLSTSNFAAGALSMTFASNRGADEVIVRSGALDIAAGDFPSGSTPNAFGKMIAFSTPFVYQGGPLLIEIAASPFTTGTFVDDSDFSQTAGQQLFANGLAATTATFNESQIFALQLQTEPVPEPASIALMSLGLGAIFLVRRRYGVR